MCPLPQALHSRQQPPAVLFCLRRFRFPRFQPGTSAPVPGEPESGHKRNALERKKPRKINASKAPHRGRTIYESSCLNFIELAVTKTWRKNIERLIPALVPINKTSALRARNGEFMMKPSNPTTIHWIIHISQRKEPNAHPGKQKPAGKQRHGYPGLCD